MDFESALAIQPTRRCAVAVEAPQGRRRLGVVAIVSILYALAFQQSVVDVLLIGLNGIGVLVGALALIVAVVSIRRQRHVALTAAGVYGACTAAHVAAIVLLLAS